VFQSLPKNKFKMSIDYKDICLKVAELSQDTGRNLKALRNQQVPEAESKGKNDFVTQFDKETEAKLINAFVATAAPFGLSLLKKTPPTKKAPPTTGSSTRLMAPPISFTDYFPGALA
jgi:hypothetical protein